MNIKMRETSLNNPTSFKVIKQRSWDETRGPCDTDACNSTIVAVGEGSQVEESNTGTAGYTRDLNLQGSVQLEVPWWIWLVASTDIISAGYITPHLVYGIFTLPITELHLFLWRVCCGGLAVVTGLIQSIGLLKALKSGNNSEIFWFCKIWYLCNAAFVLELVLLGIVDATCEIPQNLALGVGLEVATRCTYKIVCSFFLFLYYRRLKRSIGNTQI